jgi:hypothetical protein
MNVPIVTEVIALLHTERTLLTDMHQYDLQCFHNAHLGPAPTQSSASVRTGSTIQSNADDGLGYYADGTKRTLTDEEIAIFRHSELQQVIRAKHNSELDGESAGAATKMDAVEKDAPEKDRGDRPINKSSNRSQKRARGVSNSGTGRRSYKRNKMPAKAPNTDNGEDRHDPNDYIAEGGTHTLRRIAREMDELKPEAIELDY